MEASINLFMVDSYLFNMDDYCKRIRKKEKNQEMTKELHLTIETCEQCPYFDPYYPRCKHNDYTGDKYGSDTYGESWRKESYE